MATRLNLSEKFQCEIGRRILGLSKFHSKTAVRVALHWPSMSTRTLLRKLSFLGKLICNNADTMSSRIFTTICMDDIYSLSIVQQCRMLEAPLATDVVHQLLSDLPNAKSIIVKNKKLLLERDYDLLLVSAKAHPTARYISQIASHTSWRKIWDNALDYGVKGTISCQALLRELSRPTFGDRKCHLCGDQISSFPLHLCNDHPSLVCHTSLSSVVSKVSSLDMKFIITVGSKLIFSRLS